MRGAQPRHRAGGGAQWRGGEPAPLIGELADVVEAPIAVVVPPGAIVRGLSHAVLEHAAIGLVGAERVRRGAGPGAGLRAGGAVPGEEGYALAVLEEVEALGAPVVHTQPHRPVVGGERRAQVAGERLHLPTVSWLSQAPAPRHTPRLRRSLSLEVAREQEALVAKTRPLQAACGWGGAGPNGGGVRASEAGRGRGQSRQEPVTEPPGGVAMPWGGIVGGVVRPEQGRLTNIVGSVPVPAFTLPTGKHTPNPPGPPPLAPDT